MNFKTEVLEQSKLQAVLVDFWAPWCGPCRVLGPKLEKLAEEANEKWKLVKVNTEEFPEIAQDYGIRSIPNVKLFINGEVVSEFAGAYPEHWILNWLSEFIPGDEELEYSELEKRLEHLIEEERLIEIEGFINKYPGHQEALILKAKLILINQPDEIVSILTPIKMSDQFYSTADHFRNLAKLLLAETEIESSIGQIVSRFKLALGEEDFEQAAQQIIQLVLTDKSWMDELARKAGIGFFYLIGLDHPVTKEYRRKFDMALY